MRMWFAAVVVAGCGLAPGVSGRAVAASGPRLAMATRVGTLCAFDQGPRAGQTQDYGRRDPLLVGSSCWDGIASYGTIVAVVAPPPSHHAKPTPEHAQVSTLCRYKQGPRAGQTQDYAPRAAIPVGSSCWDGTTSYGTIVASGAGHP